MAIKSEINGLAIQELFSALNPRVLTNEDY
jgi:hypothetical protein